MQVHIRTPLYHYCSNTTTCFCLGLGTCYGDDICGRVSVSLAAHSYVCEGSDRHQLEAQSLRKVLCSVLEAVGFGFLSCSEGDCAGACVYVQSV